MSASVHFVAVASIFVPLVESTFAAIVKFNVRAVFHFFVKRQSADVNAKPIKDSD